MEVNHGGLYSILTKESGFGLRGMVHCGEVTRKYMGETNGRFQAILARFVYASWCGLSIFGGENCALPGKGEEDIFIHKAVYDLLLGRT